MKIIVKQLDRAIKSMPIKIIISLNKIFNLVLDESVALLLYLVKVLP